MAPDFRSSVDPAHTVLVTQELQNGVVGPSSPLAELAAAATGAVEAAARLCDAAREHGVPVIHCVAQRRPDGLGSNTNARLFAAAAKLGLDIAPGSPGANVVAELGPDGRDLVLRRHHGLGPMGGTDLDAVLRNIGVTTIVGVGVSVNVAMTNFVMDAVNMGYRFVLPRDAVAGTPQHYADDVIDHTLSLLATVTTADEVIEAWRSA